MAIDMFLKLDKIKGESVADGHADEIDLLSYSWGMNQAGSMHTATGGGVSKVNVHDIVLTHNVDAASPALAQACCKGTHLDSAVLTLQKAGGDKLAYMTITMNDVLVTQVAHGSSAGDDRISESVSLNFSKFKVSYQPQDGKGAKKGGAIDFGYDIAANKQT
jgi:type VI secretion system secreted protein Hcp